MWLTGENINDRYIGFVLLDEKEGFCMKMEFRSKL